MGMQVSCNPQDVGDRVAERKRVLGFKGRRTSALLPVHTTIAACGRASRKNYGSAIGIHHAHVLPSYKGYIKTQPNNGECYNNSSASAIYPGSVWALALLPNKASSLYPGTQVSSDLGVYDQPALPMLVDYSFDRATSSTYLLTRAPHDVLYHGSH